MILNSIWENPAIILILLIVFFGIIALIVFLLRKYVINAKKEEIKKEEQELAKEDLDRYLVDVDEDTQKEFDKLNENNKEEDK